MGVSSEWMHVHVIHDSSYMKPIETFANGVVTMKLSWQTQSTPRGELANKMVFDPKGIYSGENSC